MSPDEDTKTAFNHSFHSQLARTSLSIPDDKAFTEARSRAFRRVGENMGMPFEREMSNQRVFGELFFFQQVELGGDPLNSLNTHLEQPRRFRHHMAR